jgi:DNA-binding NarL/FixJ family response regulator
MMQPEEQGDILLVDDERPVLRMLEQVLGRNGYSCRSATDTQEAREFLARHHFDLVLSDIRMPGESGIDLCRYIKSAYPRLGVVLVTGVDDMDTAKEALSLDIYGYILKPVHRNQILISVANAMRRQRLEARDRHHREHLEKMVREKTDNMMQMNEILKRREAELEVMNSTLTILLHKIEQEKEAIETSVIENINKCVLPYLVRLRNSRLDNSQALDLDIVEQNVRDVVSSFGRTISSAHLKLTQTEIQVATLIRQGMSTKEIASFMKLSINTIMSHRAHIRGKLDLKSKKGTLFAHLNAME